MTSILITGTFTFASLLLGVGHAHASGPTSPRIEPEVTAPDCALPFAIWPLTGCHVPNGIDRTGTGDPDLPRQPVDEPPAKEPPSDPCASMWTPGRHATFSDPCQ